MSKQKLITEISRAVNITESNEHLFIEGIFSSADLMNANGRRYRRDILDREVKKVQEKLDNKCLWGELGHPPSPEINPERIAIRIESLDWQDNDLIGRAKVVDTPMGKIAKTLIKEGKLGISSRGLGTVSEEDNYVNDDYNMITYDLVTDPSNSPSWVKGIYEGQEFETFTPVEKKVIEEIIEPEFTVEDARREYKKHIWQVIENIEKSL